MTEYLEDGFTNMRFICCESVEEIEPRLDRSAGAGLRRTEEGGSTARREEGGKGSQLPLPNQGTYRSSRLTMARVGY